MELDRIGELNAKLKELLVTVEADIAEIEDRLLKMELPLPITIPLEEKDELVFVPIGGTKGLKVVRSVARQSADWTWAERVHTPWREVSPITRAAWALSIHKAIPQLLEAIEETLKESLATVGAVSESSGEVEGPRRVAEKKDLSELTEL